MTTEKLQLIRETLTFFKEQQEETMSLFERVLMEQNKQAATLIEMLSPTQQVVPTTTNVTLPKHIKSANGHTKAVAKAMSTVTVGQFNGVTRSELSLSYLPQADFIEFNWPANYITVVVNDGGGLCEQVVAELAAKGHQSVVINLVGTTGNFPQQINLASDTDEAIKAGLDQAAQYGQIASFIYLHPHFEFTHGRFAQHFQTELALLKQAFLLAKHLAAPLNEVGTKYRANFITVSQLDGKLGWDKRGNVSVVGGGLPGLVKSLNLEWSPVFCKAVDIQPELDAVTKAQQIVREMHDAHVSIQEVGFSSEGRQQIAVTEQIIPEGKKIQSKVTKDAVFLVSGGAKGVTAKCVIEMAKAFQCKFILLGRSDANVELPAYAHQDVAEPIMKRNIMEDLKSRGEKPDLNKVKRMFSKISAKKEIDATLAAVRSHGGQAIYVSGDVTNFLQTKKAIAPAVAQLGKITGVMHGAGRLADKKIQDKTAKNFDDVLSVKLDGLLTLLGCIDVHNLEHFILFSSVAGFYGNVGQTDYAMANEILSKAAHLFKTNHSNTHVAAINWGAWDSGMVSGALKKKFEEAGVSLVNSEGGPRMLVNELSNEYFSQPQMIIGGTLPAGISYLDGGLQTHRIHRSMKEGDNPFLQHHVIQGQAVLPVVNAVGWMAQTCERLYTDFRLFEVRNTQLFKGLVFDGNEPTDFILEAKEVAKNKEEIIFEATIMSPGKKLPLYHYKATVVLVHKSVKRAAQPFRADVNPTFVPQSGATLYTDGSLFHGKYFQGIEQILDWNEKGITLSCKAPEVPLSEQGQFPIDAVNTFFADIQYQGMVIWVQKYNKGAKSLPLATESATMYEPIPFGKELFVHVEIVESSAFKMTANCTVYDATGKVYMYTHRGAVTVSETLTW